MSNIVASSDLTRRASPPRLTVSVYHSKGLSVYQCACNNVYRLVACPAGALGAPLGLGAPQLSD